MQLPDFSILHDTDTDTFHVVGPTGAILATATTKEKAALALRYFTETR